jgi:hypothetical protein
VEVDAANTRTPKSTEQQTSDDRSDNTEQCVQKNTFSMFVDEFTGDKSSYQAQYDPQ